MSSPVDLWCFFGWRSGEDSPELLLAWDEYSVEQNQGGFEDVCEAALVENGIDPAKGRVVRVRVDYDKVMEAFWPSEIEGEVSGGGSAVDV